MIWLVIILPMVSAEMDKPVSTEVVGGSELDLGKLFTGFFQVFLSPRSAA